MFPNVPKRHVAVVARRKTGKVGSKKGSDRVVQIVTDGDNDLANYVVQFFPYTLDNIDMFHINEYLVMKNRWMLFHSNLVA